VTFSVNGRCHQVLQALRHDGWSHDDLIRLIVRGPNWSHHRAAHFLILALIDAGLVRNRGAFNAITEAGRDALADLDAGFSVGGVGTPRVQFTRRAGEVAKNPSPVAG
jgi:hypothetical protein